MNQLKGKSCNEDSEWRLQKNGKRHFVPRDQVFPLLVVDRSLYVHKNNHFHATTNCKIFVTLRRKTGLLYLKSLLVTRLRNKRLTSPSPPSFQERGGGGGEGEAY